MPLLTKGRITMKIFLSILGALIPIYFLEFAARKNYAKFHIKRHKTLVPVAAIVLIIVIWTDMKEVFFNPLIGIVSTAIFIYILDFILNVLINRFKS